MAAEVALYVGSILWCVGWSALFGAALWKATDHEESP